ncbi:restriction endonuclease subunit S [Bifidobacterium psychraerophilum]|uniref:restriction endonuclease subunit S n=1 Tax=Bifidobacterium psychraerophilum TaxID=218140 RepID=UPI003114CB7A
MTQELDLTDWKPFRIGDWFDVTKGSRLRSLDRIEGDTPYVGASLFNNGYTQMIGNDEHIHPGNVLTTAYNGTIPGKTFYQPVPFWATDDVNVLYPKFKMTPESGLFIAPLIEVVGKNYVYVDKWKLQDMVDAVILLPVTPAGLPDWEYMEQTMHTVTARQVRRLDLLRSFSAPCRAEIDTKSWVGFKVGDLFNIKPTRAYKATNSQLFNDDGSNPVIVNSALNNGVGGLTKRQTTERGGIITFSDTTTSEAVFYQAEDFVGYPHVQGMYPIGKYVNEWNEERLLFFLSIFKKAAILRGFDYRDKFTRKLASSLVVRLPVTAGRNPDWEYMEQTMHEVVLEREASLDSFQKLAVDLR